MGFVERGDTPAESPDGVALGVVLEVADDLLDAGGQRAAPGEEVGEIGAVGAASVFRNGLTGVLAHGRGPQALQDLFLGLWQMYRFWKRAHVATGLSRRFRGRCYNGSRLPYRTNHAHILGENAPIMLV
ncbi:hypothetical protein D3C78_1471940 [compost metagenome]